MGKAVELVHFTKKTDKDSTDKSSTHVGCCLVGQHNKDILSGAVVPSCRPLLLNGRNLVSMQGAVVGWLKVGPAGVSLQEWRWGLVVGHSTKYCCLVLMGLHWQVMAL